MIFCFKFFKFIKKKKKWKKFSNKDYNQMVVV